MAYFRCTGNSGGSIEKKTASGSIATFTTAIPTALADVTSVIGYRESGYTTATAINSKTAPIHDFAPYHTRINNNIGNLALEKLVGVSCVFNQLVQNGNFVDSSNWSTWGNLSFSVNSGVGVMTVTSTIESQWNCAYQHTVLTVGHKYLMSCSVKSKYDGALCGITNTNRASIPTTTANTWTNLSSIFDATGNYNDIQINFGANYASYAANDTIEIKNVFAIDLTAMFGSTVADYIYTLESGTAGAGVSLFKSLFADEYYPYTSNTLMSAKPTSKVIKDSNDQTVATIVYSGNELRGLLKVGTDGLYADGDIDDGSGSTQVRYELRAYQSGDESLTDAITDGTNTVVKLATPTTAVSTAWSNPIIAKEGGTEEFIDTRAIKMFTGHDTIYGTDMTVNKAEFGTTVYGGSVDFTTGDVISNKNADGTDKTAESISITPVPIMANFGANNLMSDTNGDTTVQYLDLRSI